MERHFSDSELIENPIIHDLLRWKCFNLLGLSWGKYVYVYRDNLRSGYVCVYE